MTSSRLSAALLVAVVACGRSGGGGEGAPKPLAMDPVTAEEAAQLAQAYAAAVEPCDPAKASALVDIENIIRRGMHASGLEGRVQREVYEGMHQASSQVGDLLCANISDGMQTRLVRIRDVGGKPTPLFRSAADDGYNYFELELGKSKRDHRVRIVDIYHYMSGERLSDSYAGLARASKSSMSSGLGRAMKAVTMAREAGELEEARRLLDRLPAEVRNSKQVMVLELQLVTDDDAAYLAQVEKIEKAFPDDPAMDMISIDGHFLRKDLPNLLRALDRLDKRLGGDAYIDYMRASAYLLEPTPENLTRADVAARAAIAGLPDRWDAHTGLLEVQVKQRKHADAIATLTTLRDKFEFNLDPESVAGDQDWDVFLATPEYKAFVGDE